MRPPSKIKQHKLDWCGDYVSEAQRQLIRRGALLSAESERLEALWAQEAAEFDLATYVVTTNALRRVFETLGIERRPRLHGPVSIKDYLEAKANEGHAP